MTCNGDCNQGRECICECKPPTNMVTVPLNVLEDMQRRLKATQERIAELEVTQEPVLYIDQDGLDGHATWAQATRCQDSDIALYTHPPKQWQGLSDDEINDAVKYLQVRIDYPIMFARLIEMHLKEKNG